MKNSDKLLLSIIIGFFVLFGITNLTLYRLYKSGHVIRESDLFESSPVRKAMPAPGYLAVSKVSTVHLVPSDHFAVEYDLEKLKPEKAALLADLDPRKYSDLKYAPPPLSFSQKGDSITISGSSEQLFLPGQVLPFSNVTIYFPSIPSIFLDGVSVDLPGSLHPNGPDCQLILKRCHATIGGRDDDEGVAGYLGALSIRSANSNISFEPQLHIRDLKLALDDSTDIYQLGCQVGTIHIQAGDNSKIIISGENIRKLLETNKAENK